MRCQRGLTGAGTSWQDDRPVPVGDCGRVEHEPRGVGAGKSRCGGFLQFQRGVAQIGAHGQGVAVAHDAQTAMRLVPERKLRDRRARHVRASGCLCEQEIDNAHGNRAVGLDLDLVAAEGNEDDRVGRYCHKTTPSRTSCSSAAATSAGTS